MPPEVRPEIIDAVIDNDLVGITIRVMTVVKPVVPGTSREEISSSHAYLLHSYGGLITAIQVETQIF